MTMASLVVCYDPSGRLVYDSNRAPGTSGAMLAIDGPPDNDEHIEALAQQLARLLLMQIKPT